MIIRIVGAITLLSMATTLGSFLFLRSIVVFGSIPMWGFILEFLVIEALLVYGTFDHRSPLFGPIFFSGPRNLRAISISFDDGPNEPYTSEILDILKQYGVKATFFVIGKNAEVFPEPLKRLVEDGHEVGNHTYDHSVLPLFRKNRIIDQISRTSDVIGRIGGVRPKLFRAPHGWRNPWTNAAIRSAGCIPVAWTLGVWDTDRPGANEIVKRTVKGIKNGTILLLHDGRGLEHGTDSSQLIGALPRILEYLQKYGYEFLTISEMIEKAKWG